MTIDRISRNNLPIHHGNTVADRKADNQQLKFNAVWTDGKPVSVEGKNQDSLDPNYIAALSAKPLHHSVQSRKDLFINVKTRTSKTKELPTKFLNALAPAPAA